MKDVVCFFSCLFFFESLVDLFFIGKFEIIGDYLMIYLKGLLKENRGISYFVFFNCLFIIIVGEITVLRYFFK